MKLFSVIQDLATETKISENKYADYNKLIEQCMDAVTVFNPFPPSVPIWHRLAKISILLKERIIKIISYQRREYESVDEYSLS